MSVRMQHFLELRSSRLAGLSEKLVNLNPLNILSRGYSVTFVQPSGAIVKDAASLRSGDTLKTVLFKGTVHSTVTEVRTENGGH
jgi:exodeoxyribonuclease VII large subunit